MVELPLERNFIVKLCIGIASTVIHGNYKQKVDPMSEYINGTSKIIRTERGLSINGTRLLLYDVMDFYMLGYPREAIRDRLLLTDSQIDSALTYIDAHQEEVTAEYQQILQAAEENREHWDERLRKHLANRPVTSLPPKQAALRTKFQNWKTQRSA